MPEAKVDMVACAELIRRKRYGELFEILSPFLESGLLKDRELVALPGSDHIENVMLELARKLLREDGKKLATYLTWQRRHPDKTLLDWLRIVRRHAVNDYKSQRLRQGKTSASDGSRLREVLVDLEDLLGGRRPRFTRYRLVRRIVEVADAVLSERQYRALELWLQDCGFEEIGRDLGCDPDEAKRLIDSAKVRLRRQFQDEADD